jgi:hypothetical protein
LEILKLLLDSKACSSLVNFTLPSGKSALHIAAERGDHRACDKLLSAGASLDVLTCGGRSALYAAVEHVDPETVEIICSHAEVRHLKHQTPGGVSPISLAERRGKVTLILPMLRCYQRQVKARQASKKPASGGDVVDSYLAGLCLRYQEQLLQYESELNARSEQNLADDAVTAIDNAAGELAAEKRDALHGDAAIAVGRHRKRMGLPVTAAAAAAAVPSATESTRRAWGSAVPRRRPASACKRSTQQPESTGGIVARYPLTQLWRESVQKTTTRAAANGIPVGRVAQLPPLAKTDVFQRSAAATTAAAVAAVSRERAAAEADDAMALLLDDSFSDDEDEEGDVAGYPQLVAAVGETRLVAMTSSMDIMRPKGYTSMHVDANYVDTIPMDGMYSDTESTTASDQS